MLIHPDYPPLRIDEGAVCAERPGRAVDSRFCERSYGGNPVGFATGPGSRFPQLFPEVASDAETPHDGSGEGRIVDRNRPDRDGIDGNDRGSARRNPRFCARPVGIDCNPAALATASRPSSPVVYFPNDKSSWSRLVCNDRIRTTQHYPGEWSAVTDEYDGPGSPIGTGSTEAEAVGDLENLGEQIEAAIAVLARVTPEPQS